MSADPDDLAPDDGRDDATDPADGSPTSADPNQASFLDAPPAAVLPREPAAKPAPEPSRGAQPAPASPAPVAATAAPAAGPAVTGEYRVLARKYRPQTFAELIGQQAMVRTLTNAFDLDRVHHAFILTGVRGVGKTTTARIVAKALNCVGPGGDGGPTISPCGVCANCTAIAADRHPDVMEMDAASRTGINDIREILDSVRYRPVLARYKVYIIDEVHMLSPQAFNGLLKTLEEPPGHVKFIFATTETRKVPVTVLSRCQRFDLRRVGADTLMTHLGGVAAAEGASLDDGALRLIARAADGSVRDGLSLLDQAISAFASGGATASEADIRGMLGLADAGGVYDLFEAVMRGDAAAALGRLQAMYDVGADPLVVLRDLLELSHWITRVKLVPATADVPSVSETERLRGQAMAATLPVSALSRAWQIALKGLGEAQAAPAALPAVEMVLIRLAHAAELPTPGDIVRRLQGEAAAPTAPAAASPPPGGSSGGGGAQATATTSVAAVATGGSGTQAGAVARARPLAPPRVQPDRTPDPESFRDLVDLFGARKLGDLRNHLYLNVHPVAYEPGRLEFRPREAAPRDLAGQVLGALRDWCGAHWTVSVSGAPGEATLAEQDRARAAAQRAAAEQHPVVRAALAAFPGARIERVTALDGVADEALLDTEAAIPPDDELGEDDELLIETLDERFGDEGYADLDRGYAGPDDGDEFP